MHHAIPARPTRARRVLAVAAVTAAVVLAPLAGSALPLGFAEEAHDHRAVAARADDRSENRADEQADGQADEQADDRDQDRNRDDGGNGDRGENRDAAADGNDDANDDGNRNAAADGNDDGNRGGASNDDTVGAGGKDGENNGLDVLGRDCSESKLKPHDGFQASPACVSTQMGEVAAEDKLPSLVIKEAPKTVAKGEDFELKVSTRNLVRDRFLGAAAGGYYLEASFLNDDGLQRGHFHTACRMLPADGDAPDSSGEPEFFLATEDGKGGTDPDTVTIEVPGVDKTGELQCTSWAGDGSHRTPMMTKANQTPAIDSVRIDVTG